MSTSIDYYFNKTEAFVFPGFFDGLTKTFDILPKAEQLLKDILVTPNVTEMRGTEKGGGASYYGNYFIDEGTVIYNDVTIIGPVYIGRNCEISHGAVIRPYTIISDNCSVGHGSEVKRSVLMKGAKVASLAFCGDSILGASARIGSGVITANRKFNQSEVTIRDEGQKVSLGGDYFGCVLGDSARLGANAVTQPGTHVGPYTWIYPGTVVRGFIARAKRVYNAAELVFEDNEIVELEP
jgi:bifunctional UDP-N-acetylglucosamine pyrophosphorylase/glucosamine-1-phosphate N-acetyltransferase